MTDYINLKLFYPMLFLTIIIIVTLLTINIKSILIKTKDNKLFNNIFDKHTEEHVDTTSKFTQVAILPVKYEKELHDIEKSLRMQDEKILELTEDINNKIDLLISRVQKLENLHKRN